MVRRFSPPAAYSIAFAATMVALLIRWAFWPVLADRIPYMTFFPAVMVAAYFGGFRPGLLATLLAAIATDYFLLPPLCSFSLPNSGDALGFIFFALVGIIISGLSESLHRARDRAAEDARRLDESESRYREALDGISDAFVQLDSGWRYVFVNGRTAEISGMPAEAMIGQTIWEVFPKLLGTEMEVRCRNAVQEQRPDQFEYYFAPFDRWFEQRLYPSKTGLAIFSEDITDRKRAEQARREGQERFRNLAEAMPQIVWTAAPDGTITFINRRWTDYTGLSLEQTNRLADVSGAIHPDDAERVFKSWQESLATGRQHEAQWRFRSRSDGSYRWFLTRAVAVRDEDGRVREWFGTATDIDDQKRAQDALVEADRRKDEFLATLAHELRNPLAPIHNSLQILRLTDDDGALLEQARSLMERQVNHLVHLIDDLMDVSRITRDKLKLRKEWLPIAEAIQAAIETARPVVDAQGHALEVSIPPEPIVVDGDRTRLAQVVSNLLTNAAKYTERGGHIQLSMTSEGGQVAIRVRDDGIGIPQAMLSRVFEMFTQLDRSLEKSQGGLGIGLSLVKRLVELHGGQVLAESDGPGKGSQFTVTLPTIVLAASNEAKPAIADGFAPTAAARRVLVVDDNRDAADSLAIVLRILGHEVRTAYDGVEALEVIAQSPPDLVFMDLGMPRMNGYDAAQQIRKLPAGASIILIALTGWGQDDDKRRTSEAGFDHHLVKPVAFADVAKLLSQPPTEPT